MKRFPCLAAEPSRVVADYAKSMPAAPRTKFAILTNRQPIGVNPLGVQVDSADEWRGMPARLQGNIPVPIVDNVGRAQCGAPAAKVDAVAQTGCRS